MAQGSFESSTGTNLEIGCEWTSSANVSANTSTVNVKVYLHHYQIYCAALSGSYVSAGNSTEYFSMGVSSSASGLQKTYIAEKNFTVPHASDGTGSVKISAGWVFNGYYNGHYIGTLETSRTVTLDRIARASDFTSLQFTLTSPSTLTVYPASSSYTHRVTLRIGSASYSTSKVSSTSVSVTPPASLAQGAPSSSRPQGTVTVETYSGNTKIGEVTKNASFRIPDSADFKPEFSLTLTPHSTSQLVSEAGIYAAMLSSLTLNVTGAAAKYGASVSSTKIVFGTKKKNGTTFNSGALTAGNISYLATVTDSRGFSKSQSGSVSVLPYFCPYAEGISVFRCDENGDPDDGGSYISAYAEGKCASLGGRNSCTLKLKVKSRSGAAVGTWVLSSGETFVINAALSPYSSYTATVEVEDAAGCTGRHDVSVPTSKVDVHLKNGRLRLGGYVERDGLECDWDARFNGSLSIGSDEVADFIVATGVDGIWTWRRYASGASECYGTTPVATYALTATYGPFYGSSDVSEARNSVAYPTGLFVSAPTVTACPARGNAAVMIAPRSAGSASATPDYRILYPTAPAGGTVDAALCIVCRGRWK